MHKPSGVVVALSGGVDSSVAAALLKQEGWEVRGVHFLLPGSLRNEEERVASVRRITEHLRIPLDVVNLQELFTRRIVEPFADLYLKGLTPNPCVLCNETVKFDQLLRGADELGFPCVATGHYAIVARLDQSAELRRGQDRKKEQSYFLHRLDRLRLARVLLPLGGLTKEETRGLATRMGLPSVSEPESQEICFVPGNDYRSFLESHRGEGIRKAGHIVDLDGRRVGEHLGAYRFTIGQRHGLGIASSRPYYVVEILADRNQVVVGREENVYSRTVEAEGASWIAGEAPGRTEGLLAQVRYRHQAAPGRLEVLPEGKVIFEFEGPQWAVTPGQALVFYDGDRVLGGAWISRGARDQVR